MTQIIVVMVTVLTIIDEYFSTVITDFEDNAATTNPYLSPT